MHTLALIILILYVVVFALVCVFGVHRYFMLAAFTRGCMHPKAPPAPLPEGSLPPVTVQLPMFNELHVARRIILAAGAMDYPADRLQIQVLDDSTDGTTSIARQACADLTAAGMTVQYLHREDRQGFKAGALANGLNTATGELVAVFDADFVPPRDFLRRIVPHFQSPQIGMVQARWAHLNREQSLLTRVQAMFLDGHFVVEQTARAAAGRWFNFNGTAGMWRRSCIETAGGWQHDTLTEDTDISYRAQLAGWKFIYVNEPACPAELPPNVSAFLSQQHRWQKGLMQTAIKLLPAIMRSNAPLRTRLEAFFHLTSPAVYLLVLTMVLLILPVLLLGEQLEIIRPQLGYTMAVAFPVFGICSTACFYLASQVAQGRSMWRTICIMPVLMAVGVGLTVNNSRAVLQAMLRRQSPFVRTPKYNGRAHSDLDPVAGQAGAARSRMRRTWTTVNKGLPEVVLGLLMLACLPLTAVKPLVVVGLPFLLLFAAGFLWMGLPALLANRSPRAVNRQPASGAMTSTAVG